MDEFEKRIRKHRQELDKLDPSPRIWENIEKELESGLGKTRTLFWNQAIKMAAVFAGLIMVFWIGYQFGNQEQGSEPIVTLPAEYLEVEKYYLEKIETTKAAVFAFPLDEDMNFQFRKDLVALDSIYNGLKELYAKKGAQPRLLENMILNLQNQTKLLQIQLEIIQKQKTRGHEKETISA